MTDGIANSNTATVTITVDATLMAVNDFYFTYQDTALNEPAPGVMLNDMVGGATTVVSM